MTAAEASRRYEAYPPETPLGYRYVFQHHWRGETVHADFRFMGTDPKLLLGWTIADEIPGQIKGAADDLAREKLGLKPGEDVPPEKMNRWLEELISISQSRSRDPGNFKIDWKTGNFLSRKTRDGNVVPAELRAFRKPLEGVAWLEASGVTAPFPAPGSTRQFRGILNLLDGSPVSSDARVEYGRQAPGFHEYFLRGGTMTGRLLFRSLSAADLAEKGADVPALKAAVLPAGLAEEDGTGGSLWVAIQPLDSTPYFISPRAVSRGNMPPPGVSGLPAKVRSAIPERFRYWEIKDESSSRETRKKLVEAIRTAEVKLDFPKLVGGRS